MSTASRMLRADEDERLRIPIVEQWPILWSVAPSEIQLTLSDVRRRFVRGWLALALFSCHTLPFRLHI